MYSSPLSRLSKKWHVRMSMADVEYEGGEAPPNGTYYYPPPPAEGYTPSESECIETGVSCDHICTSNRYVLYKVYAKTRTL